MKLCCVSLGFAFIIALTTSVECVPHARLARAVAVKPSVATLLPQIVKSLPSTRSPNTGNTGLDSLSGAIVKAKMAETDLKGEFTQPMMTKLATDMVTSLASASGTPKANETKLLTFVKKGIKSCSTYLDCVVKQVGLGGKFLDPSVVDKLQQLQTAIDKMNKFDPANPWGGNTGALPASLGSMFNGLGAAAGGGGLDSFLKGFGTDTSKLTSMFQNAGVGSAAPAGASVPTDTAKPSLDSLLGSLKSSSNADMSLLGKPVAQGPNGVGSVPAGSGAFDFKNMLAGWNAAKDGAGPGVQVPFNLAGLMGFVQGGPNGG